MRPCAGTIPVSVGGSSADAYRVGGRQGDIFGLWGEPLRETAEQIAAVSQHVTLEPGDILLTGTPAGVGLTTGTFLNVGDQLEAEIEGLGVLDHRHHEADRRLRGNADMHARMLMHHAGFVVIDRI